jgi:DNA polymerase/3'-5' exonuclease PolX
MKLDRAEKLASMIATELQPFCTRIEIAGSIRRRRAEVNDIDLVLVPETLESRAEIVKRCSFTCTKVSGDTFTAQNIIFRFPSEFQLDLFFAHDGIVDLVSKTPSNWGAVLLCRTGSIFHNQQLCSHAITKGLKFAPYKGVVRAGAQEEIIASETEESIYQALDLEYRLPTQRESILQT